MNLLTAMALGVQIQSPRAAVRMDTQHETPRRATASAYKPAHGGYPGLVTLGRWQPQRGVIVRTVPAKPPPGYRTPPFNWRGKA